jgi:hypothetical protein
LKKKRQEIANSKRIITSNVFPVDTAINEVNKKKTNRASYKKIANRVHKNETVVTLGEPNYSDQRDTPRFVKPPMATDD